MNDRRLDRVPFVGDCMEEIHARLAGKLPAIALPELDRAEAELRTALQRIEGREDALVALRERSIGIAVRGEDDERATAARSALADCADMRRFLELLTNS